eukprot:CAMPEP_0194519144 /NCGR_PEP_ID=MMETSP0253-20130528/52735_1 /TAXON_ID=2966 /ORGANISM="Noctiluca scintillans" /LENGTH=98 /DNA_ID=CAMNT_0039363245 /DNA_START=44 /DNA_END=336 /DNA_ORIENTATION=+
MSACVLMACGAGVPRDDIEDESDGVFVKLQCRSVAGRHLPSFLLQHFDDQLRISVDVTIPLMSSLRRDPRPTQVDKQCVLLLVLADDPSADANRHVLG